jgi:aspartyl/glutamyl-tRNA(Asn/Gln) amidotransferase C subunit
VQFPAGPQWSTRSLDLAGAAPEAAALTADVLALARLAAVALDPADAPAVQQDVQRVVGLFRAVQAVDTAGVAPLVTVAPAGCTPLRADEPATVPVDVALANAPARASNYFVAPKGRAFTNMDGTQ